MYSLDLKLTTVCSIRASPPLPSCNLASRVSREREYIPQLLGGLWFAFFLPLENKDKAEAFSSLFLFSLFPLLSSTFWPKRQHGKNATMVEWNCLPSIVFLSPPPPSTVSDIIWSTLRQIRPIELPLLPHVHHRIVERTALEFPSDASLLPLRLQMK